MNHTIDLSKIAVNKKKQNNSGLGRGLSALLSDTPHAISSNSMETTSDLKNSIVQVSLSLCVPSAYQARQHFDDNELANLASSIKDKGVIQPVVLRKQGNTYEIVAGERRCRAAKIAGLSTVSAVIMDLTDKDAMEIGLIENLQRKDLNPIDEANGYRSLIEKFSYTHDDIAKIAGKSRSYITNYLRILNLPEGVKKFIEEGKISAGHAKLLLSVDNPIDVANNIINQNYSVRETEKIIRDNNPSIKKMRNYENSSIPAEFIEWYNKAKSYYSSLDIKINSKNQQNGEIKIKYSNLDELKKFLNIYEK